MNRTDLTRIDRTRIDLTRIDRTCTDTRRTPHLPGGWSRRVFWVLSLLLTLGLLDVPLSEFGQAHAGTRSSRKKSSETSQEKPDTLKKKGKKTRKVKTPPALVGGLEQRYAIDRCVYGGVGLVRVGATTDAPHSVTPSLWIPDRLLPGRCQEGRELLLRLWSGWSPRVDPLDGIRVRGAIERLESERAGCFVKGQDVHLPRALLPPKAVEGMRFTLVSRWGQTTEALEASMRAASALHEKLEPAHGQAQLNWVVERAGPDTLP